MPIIWAIIAILLVFWAIGAVINIIGFLIHGLLVLAVILILVALFRRKPVG